ncbi:MAG: amidohydrolase [Oscillospiraceae bacterium]
MSYIDEVKKIVNSLGGTIIAASDEIWGYNELYFEEYKSSAALAKYAADAGFFVQQGVCDMPTGFVAHWGTGKIKVGILAEYDALPALSQKAEIVCREPAQGDTVSSPGHGCGHNCLGAGALGAAIALKEYCQANPLDIQIYLFGCPAEENGSGKMFMAREKLFDPMDFCIGWHPHPINEVSGTSTLACLSIKFAFHGISSHAASTPHLGRSALDACEIMNVGVNYLREHIIPEARVHYSYLDVGGKAPNVVQDFAATYYFVRAPKVSDALEIADRVHNIAKGAALMTGTTVDITSLDGLCDFVPNRALSTAAAEVFAQVGAPNWTKQDTSLALKYTATFDGAQIAHDKEKLCKINNLSVENCGDLVLDSYVSPYHHQPEKVDFGSTDVGDVSYCTPTAQIYVATCALGTQSHSWQMTGQGKTSISQKGTLTAAAVIAATAIKVASDSELLQQIKKEHAQNVPCGYICPAPADLKPTIS